MQMPRPSPYRELPDIIRRRGRTRVGGSSLWSIVRNVLGSLLGFRSTGIVSWLIRIFLMRYGWRILRLIFGRMFLGR
jgi:hypothetical protein